MIFNLGSINADHFYEVPHLPSAGETIAATRVSSGLGGKGANMSVAVARAGGAVRHIGAVGSDGDWARTRLQSFGVDVRDVAAVDGPTGHAIISLDSRGENAIVIFPGANRAQSEDRIEAALGSAKRDDILLLQNETNGQERALSVATTKGMTRIYAAAPFDRQAVLRALPWTDILVLNEVEMQQLQDASGKEPAQLGVAHVVVTRGARGVRIFDTSAEGVCTDIPAPSVDPVDTTGAGDTFTGYMAAGLDAGMALESAVQRAVWAAALKVTRKGTADAIPSLQEVHAYMAQDPANGAF